MDGDSTVEHLRCEDWFPRPLDQVFSFFADARNLEKITPDFLRFQVLRSSDHPIRRGTLIDYRLRLHGVPLTWRTRIDEWVPDSRFVDRQLRGPYKLWHHTHEFEAHNGGTLMRDHVRYQLPFGTLGKAVAGKFVRRDVERIFRHRQLRTRAIFGGDTTTLEQSPGPRNSESQIGTPLPDTPLSGRA